MTSFVENVTFVVFWSVCPPSSMKKIRNKNDETKVCNACNKNGLEIVA